MADYLNLIIKNANVLMKDYIKTMIIISVILVIFIVLNVMDQEKMIVLNKITLLDLVIF